MIRGSTPRHSFTLPFEPPEGTEFRIVYAQGEDHNETILFERTTSTCEVSGCVVSVQLTADETLKINCAPHWQDGKFAPYPVKIQIGCKTPGGETIWSDIIEEHPNRCLRKDGIV